jgi:hypothetical protein
VDYVLPALVLILAVGLFLTGHALDAVHAPVGERAERMSLTVSAAR